MRLLELVSAPFYVCEYFSCHFDIVHFHHNFQQQTKRNLKEKKEEKKRKRKKKNKKKEEENKILVEHLFFLLFLFLYFSVPSFLTGFLGKIMNGK